MKQGWEIKKLGDICTIKGRIGFRGYTRNDLVEEGEGAITLSPSNIVNDVINFDKCQYISWYKYDESPEIQIFEGDVIYAKTASIGKVAIIKHLPEKATINPQFVVFKDIKCNHDFLYYAVRGNGFKEQVSLIINGVAIPTISQSNMAKLTIPVPPIAEQAKIVEELDCLSGIIEKKKQQLKELDALAQSIFYEMFGDPVENDKGWETKSLKNSCVQLFAGGDVPKNNFSKVKTNEHTVPIISNGVGEKALYGYTSIAKVNEACITIAGRGTIGYCEVRDVPFFPVVRLIVAIPKKERLLPIVLRNIIDAHKFKGTGGAIPQLTIPMIKDCSIILPPLPLQQEFASKIEAIENQKELIAQSIKETETLFNSRMDYYFN
jgi:type I restriction enzyme S subunit